MECPICRSESSKVIDSKPQKDKIRRRRQCNDCGARFFTEETVVSDSSRSIDASFESMYAMADGLKNVAISSAIQAIAQLNDLAERSAVGFFPFSEIPELACGEDFDDFDHCHNGVVIDDNPNSDRYLSIVADMCIFPDHHDIISYMETTDALEEPKAEWCEDHWCVYMKIPGTELVAIVSNGRWHLS